MKLLFDQNLSRKLPRRLSDLFPGCGHIYDLHLDRSTDTIVWAFARDNGHIIVSKDDDFRQRSIDLGHPPKVIWLSVGNCRVERIEALLRDRFPQITAFDADPNAAMLVLP